jgi:uncharacterized membrane protein YqjE
MTPPDEQPPPAPQPGKPVGSTLPEPAEPAEASEPPKPSEPPKVPVAEAPKPPPAPAAPKVPPAAASTNGDAPGKTVGELFLEVSEQATILVREEIELAKTEVTEKVGKLLRGSLVGLVAGIFLLLALFLVMHGVAILLGDNLFGHRVWLGYLVEAAVFTLIAAAGGFYAYRAVKKGSPPVPEMAIEQAKEIRASLEDDD